MHLNPQKHFRNTTDLTVPVEQVFSSSSVSFLTHTQTYKTQKHRVFVSLMKINILPDTDLILGRDIDGVIASAIWIKATLTCALTLSIMYF